MSFKSRTAWWRILCVNIPPLRETAPDLNFETSCKFWQIIDLRSCRGHPETWQGWRAMEKIKDLLSTDACWFWLQNCLFPWTFLVPKCWIIPLVLVPNCWINPVQLWAITLGPLCVWFAPPPSGGYEGHLWEGGLRHLVFGIRFPICATGICIYPQKRFEPPLPTISIGILFGISLEQSKTIQNLVETSWCTQLSRYIL